MKEEAAPTLDINIEKKKSSEGDTIKAKLAVIRKEQPCYSTQLDLQNAWDKHGDAVRLVIDQHGQDIYIEAYRQYITDGTDSWLKEKKHPFAYFFKDNNSNKYIELALQEQKEKWNLCLLCWGSSRKRFLLPVSGWRRGNGRTSGCEIS